MPAGRVPAIFRAPLGRSRQPMARTMAFASMVKMPSSSLVAVMVLSGVTDSTMVFNFTGIPRSRTCFSYFQAYSGPVSSSPKRCRPKPLWMHCCRMPPSRLSLSRIKISLMPLSYAATAALIPAGPPPMITKSVILLSSPLSSLCHCLSRQVSLPAPVSLFPAQLSF